MSVEDFRYRSETADEVVQSREVVQGPVRMAGEPGHAERSVSRGASPLATWINVATSSR